jgi:hypothetical protein
MDHTNYLAALSQPYLSGVRYNFKWSDINPSNGTYNFTNPLGGSGTSFNTYIQNAMAQGLNICISLMCGESASGTPPGPSPGWLTAVNVVCGPYIAPLPWDANYSGPFNAAINAIAAQLVFLGAQSYVKVVKMSGISDASAEFNLEYSAAFVASNCPGGSINAAWALAGFTPALIQSTYNAMVANYINTAFPVATFPNIVYSIDTIFVNAFPPIDNSGNLYISPPARSDELTRITLAGIFANSSYQTCRFEVQWDALSNVAPAPQPVISARLAPFQNVSISWQLNERGAVAGGSWCNYGGFIGTGSISGTTLTITAVVSGAIDFIDPLSGASVVSGTTVLSQLTGTPGGIGTYTVSTAQSVPSERITQPVFVACDGRLTGTPDTDFETIITTGVNLGARRLEFWGANAAQIGRCVQSLQAKSMGLPH